ncbi:MAG: hypothetical protein E7282_09325 [Lachnospiraceae bacterium]|nr:hypothetical protein [Lachnospiraceae bacterium]
MGWGSDIDRIILIMALLLIVAVIIYLFIKLPKKSAGDDLKQLLDVVTSRTGKNQEPAYDRVRVCANRDEVLGERLRMIDHAKQEIRLSVADIRISEDGKKILAALYYAVQRGVHVSMLLNRSAYSSNKSIHDYLKALGSEENAQIKTYDGLNDHYLVVDKELLILNGRDIDAISYENRTKEIHDNWDMLVVNSTKSLQSTVVKVQQYFDLVWNQKRCKKCCGSVDLPSQKRVEHIKGELLGAYSHLQRKHMEWFYTENYEKSTVPTNRILITRGKEPQGNLILLVDSPDLAQLMF